jgi:hypothetical protein
MPAKHRPASAGASPGRIANPLARFGLLGTLPARPAATARLGLLYRFGSAVARWFAPPSGTPVVVTAGLDLQTKKALRIA